MLPILIQRYDGARYDISILPGLIPFPVELSAVTGKNPLLRSEGEERVCYAIDFKAVPMPSTGIPALAWRAILVDQKCPIVFDSGQPHFGLVCHFETLL